MAAKPRLQTTPPHTNVDRPAGARYIYERRGRALAGKGLTSAVEWMRSKGHGLKSQVTAASGAASIIVMQANAKRQYQVGNQPAEEVIIRTIVVRQPRGVACRARRPAPPDHHHAGQFQAALPDEHMGFHEERWHHILIYSPTSGQRRSVQRSIDPPAFTMPSAPCAAVNDSTAIFACQRQCLAPVEAAAVPSMGASFPMTA